MVSLGGTGNGIGTAAVPGEQATLQKTLEVFGISGETWEAYRQVKSAYGEEAGVDFGASGTLRSTSATLFLRAGKPVDNGITYRPLSGGKPLARSAEPAPADLSVADRLQERLESIRSRDEDWVRKTYSLGESEEEARFARRVAEDYRHMAEVAKRLLEVLEGGNVSVPAGKGTAPSRLLDLRA